MRCVSEGSGQGKVSNTNVNLVDCFPGIVEAVGAEAKVRGLAAGLAEPVRVPRELVVGHGRGERVEVAVARPVGHPRHPHPGAQGAGGRFDEASELAILAAHDVKATFLTCGGIAERYPDQVGAIVAAGHEVAGHGYHHEVARDLSREEEREVIRRTTEMILSRADKRPFGWRSCTQSPNSLELLLEHGYLWNSNSFSHDLPFVWQSGEKRLVELPRQPFGDGRTYGHRDSGNPNDTLAQGHQKIFKPFEFLPLAIISYLEDNAISVPVEQGQRTTLGAYQFGGPVQKQIGDLGYIQRAGHQLAHLINQLQIAAKPLRLLVKFCVLNSNSSPIP